mmetsp:Transcript_70519/g.216024  ORF Transcript_70519/g.216024 Transcript_70519/m.216024 type:complete len:247 (+) Transcript_70519:788-1528(+)
MSLALGRAHRPCDLAHPLANRLLRVLEDVPVRLQMHTYTLCKPQCFARHHDALLLGLRLQITQATDGALVRSLDDLEVGVCHVQKIPAVPLHGEELLRNVAEVPRIQELRESLHVHLLNVDLGRLQNNWDQPLEILDRLAHLPQGFQTIPGLLPLLSENLQCPQRAIDLFPLLAQLQKLPFTIHLAVAQRHLEKKPSNEADADADERQCAGVHQTFLECRHLGRFRDLEKAEETRAHLDLLRFGMV